MAYNPPARPIISRRRAHDKNHGIDKAEFLGSHFTTSTHKGLAVAWKLFHGDDSFEVLYTFILRGKTLVVDTMAKNDSNLAGVVAYGSVKGLSFTEKIEIPYYDYASGRPAVVLAQSGATPLFPNIRYALVTGDSSLSPSSGTEMTSVDVQYLPSSQMPGSRRFGNEK